MLAMSDRTRGTRDRQGEPVTARRRPGRDGDGVVPVRPEPQPSLRPWAGRRLGGDAQVGELWLAGPASLVGTGAGRETLDGMAARLGATFVGRRPVDVLGPRFPLIVKLIDAADWLSLQVHPSDEVARALYGPGSVGKTEAWVVLEADPDTRLIVGPADDLSEARLRAAISAGTLGHQDCAERTARAGDAYLIRAGTVHAIGAGVFVYEIEQPSDHTFRISDWGRPAQPGRSLHPAEALAAVRPHDQAIPAGSRWQLVHGEIRAAQFRLEVATPGVVERRPGGESLEVVTAIRGRVEVSGDGWGEVLDPYQTLVVPAIVPGYEIDTADDGLAFIGSVP
jgi:mannose-6-phosphate isomerase